MDVKSKGMTSLISRNFWVLYFIFVFGNYFTNIAFSYLNIDYSLSVGFFAISLIFGLMVIGFLPKCSFNVFPVSVALLILLTSFISVFIVNDVYKSMTLSAGAYIAAISPIVFYLIFQYGFSFSSFKSIQFFYKIITFVFILNFTVSLAQYFMYEMGVLSKSFFWDNNHLNAIIFPRVDSVDSLRVPGLFSSGGSNAVFNFIYFIGYSTVKGMRFTLPFSILLVSSSAVIFLALTRKVWLSIFVTFFLYCLLILYFKGGTLSKLIVIFLTTVFLFSLTLFLLNFSVFLELEQLLGVDVFSLNSMEERIFEWKYYINLFIDEFSFLNIFFGLSVLQEFYQYTTIDPVLIDNVFIALFFFGGLSLTFLFFLFWLYWLVIFFIKAGAEIRSNYYLGWAGFSIIVWLFFTITSMFSTFFTSYESIMIAIISFVFSSYQIKNSCYSCRA